MKNLFYKTGMLALFASVLLTGCSPEIDTPAPSAGEADFTSYIAVGNSLSAGYADGGLTRKGQLASLPAILAQQLDYAGGGEFKQPLFSEEQANGSGYLRLAGFTPQGLPITAPVTDKLAIRGGTATAPLYTKYTENVNNLSIPGIKTADINVQGYGSVQGNPYFERLTNNPSQTYLAYVGAQARAAKHTFFSLWMAENDVLGYATAGGFAGTLTPQKSFEDNFTALLDTLTAGNKKGILVTVPDVTAVPFFTTVGPSVKAALKAKGAPGFVAFTGAADNVNNLANRVLIPVGNIKDASGGKVLFTLTGAAYAPLLGTPTGKYWKDLAKDQARKQTGEDKPNPLVVNGILTVLLSRYAVDTTQSLGTSQNPWPSALLLDETELNSISSATTGFNNFIKSQAAAKDLALWDSNAFFNSIQGGFAVNNVGYSPAYISGNLFSLDGVHPTPRGYAVVANEMIKAINAKYNANIPQVDITKYDAVLFP
ncbi:SGNH/GDSL hydrolase family protein [Pontibacter ruber]|uniref:SGNH/GDSL hydrolase family protein n=1 Tax=Pontibacter ruber TaxID=1343895 RepID=A0ABW5CXY9_9BACT|nr:SGNH/GDSL hydrolase family protein [Pontibacter ruber]